jgi:hypothetical protein
MPIRHAAARKLVLDKSKPEASSCGLKLEAEA